MTDELRYDGEVALITGGGRGLGAAYARLLASRGCRVLVNDVGATRDGDATDEDPAADVAREITEAGGTALSDRHSVVDAGEAVVAHALDAFGRIDLVVNNAGNLGRGPFSDLPLDRLDHVLATHVRGSFVVTQAAWSSLQASPNGRVMFTSSQAVWGAPGSVAYSIAKAGLLGLTATLASEGAADGIRANAIMPSARTRLTTDTPQASIAGFVDEFLDPGYVAGFVAWLMHSGTAITGEVFCVGGGRAGRVFVGEAPGFDAASTEPEAWVGREGPLRAQDGYAVPGSMVEELGFQAANLGPKASEAFSRIAAG